MCTFLSISERVLPNIYLSLEIPPCMLQEAAYPLPTFIQESRDEIANALNGEKVHTWCNNVLIQKTDGTFSQMLQFIFFWCTHFLLKCLVYVSFTSMKWCESLLSVSALETESLVCVKLLRLNQSPLTVQK